MKAPSLVGPIRAFSWLKVPTSAFKFKAITKYTLLNRLKKISRHEIGTLAQKSQLMGALRIYGYQVAGDKGRDYKA